ncbi:GNAT family N-acetyltransferase [Knoellia sp. p5-6-4]|uniref:GNAT family N-acetyltransferase n=1 Tax=unclassified Knoellia TaxID=2618719 RepID=UPI0023D9B903|nr:GNAT family N-acetyltransferase [Knoellia sp. p5-6-4]MDF2146207.1 GNAT family N-acetyltransferase [Knoellia sp. p5-6-4]
MPERDPGRWVVDDLRPQDREAWSRLHRGYLEFYESARPVEVSTVVWSWLMDPDHELEAVVVRPAADAEPVGLAHYRPFPRPLHGSTACFLDDLFVAPGERGTGAVDALLAALQERCGERGWSHVRWVTRASNTTAQSTYDRLAVRTDLLTYDLDAAPRPLETADWSVDSAP